MHELSITQALVEITLRHAEGRRVEAVHLQVGELSSYVNDSIQFFWDDLTRGSVAEGARLEFHLIPATLVCIDCTHSYRLAESDFVCPRCQSRNSVPNGGNECYVESIEVEE